jgi:DNA-binding beta-propeller fold protein YncE
MLRRRSLFLLPLLLVPVALAAKPSPQLAQPYGVLVDHRGRFLVADAGRHRVFRYDARRRRLVRVAGSGRAGNAGDGGPAVRARLAELVSLTEDAKGRLYVSDLQNGVIRRFTVGGRIDTVARIPGATGIDVDPSGRYLAVASIERGVIRVELATGTLETLVPIGKGVIGPHGLHYDARGDLLVADPRNGVLRIDRSNGVLRALARIDTANVLPTARGLYVTVGSPDGGRVLLLRPDGTRRVVVGTGRISHHRDGVRATRVGILPTGLALARDGSLLVAQARPVPALRRVSRAGIITTIAR